MKKKHFIPILLIAAGLFMAGIISGFRGYQSKPWPVPDAAKNKKNPVASNAESIAAGKALWSTHCKSCHGSKGLGDGTKAATLKTETGDLTAAAAQSQT